MGRQRGRVVLAVCMVRQLWIFIITSAKEGYVFTSVCLSVCLSVRRITEKVVNGF